MTYQLPEPAYRRLSDLQSGIDNWYSADQIQQAYAAGRDELVAAVRKVHAAKGRYHSQLAMCDLYNLCVLPHERPMK